MSLSIAQSTLVHDSYAQVARLHADYSRLFYHRLFEQHPFVRALFPDDIDGQVWIFRKTIDALVASLDDFAALTPVLADLARRHVRYGAIPQHYAIIGAVLIGTLAEMLGSDFDGETRAAWEALYDATAAIMVREAYPQAG